MMLSALFSDWENPSSMVFISDSFFIRDSMSLTLTRPPTSSLGSKSSSLGIRVSVESSVGTGLFTSSSSVFISMVFRLFILLAFLLFSTYARLVRASFGVSLHGTCSGPARWSGTE